MNVKTLSPGRWWSVGVAILLAGSADAARAQSANAGDQATDQGGTNPVVVPQSAPLPAHPAGRLDYAAFKIITDRNIFDGNRSGQRITSTRSSSQLRSVQVDSFALVGTLVSSRGMMAFFDGSDSSFRKVLKTGESIAGYQVNEILPSGIRLAEGTNVMDLCVGNGMRREDGGGWRLAVGSGNYASASRSGNSREDTFDSRRSSRSGRSSGRGNFDEARTEPANSSNTRGSDSPPSAEVSEVLKRLMEQREKEIQ